MGAKDEIIFNEFKIIFDKYLDYEGLTDQQFELRDCMIQFVKTACIQSLTSF
jgi:hypothetical protein